MSVVTMRQLLEAGVHFGHQTRRWNPKMAPYIFGQRNGIHIIDLRKTIEQADRAYEFVRDTVSKQGSVLFVGTKRQARDAICEEAERCGMFYVNHRWLGGMLTNHETIKKSIRRLKRLERMEEDGYMERLPKKEVAMLRKEKLKLDRNLRGVKDMPELPDVVFITDIKGEAIAVRECQILGIPTVGIADTNTDPNDVTIPIPGNDDAIRSIRLFVSLIADAAFEGLSMLGKEVKPEELAAELSAEAAAATAEAGTELEAELRPPAEEQPEPEPRQDQPEQTEPAESERQEQQLGSVVSSGRSTNES